MLPENFPPVFEKSSALYRAVWRWHFFAGLFAAPFVVFLAITGALYLWKPQFEEWRYHDLFNVPVPSRVAAGVSEPASPLSSDAQLASACAAFPRLQPLQFIPAERPGRTAEIQFVSATGAKSSVFVDPATGAIAGRIEDATRPMRIVHDLHGTLLAGTAGEIVVELVASWTLVLLLSGLFLWCPRPFTVRGFLLPRLGAGRRTLLRDLHAVPAVWLSLCTVFLLSTGLQWTPLAGQWTRTLAQAAGQWQPRETSASAHRSEILGGWSPYLKNKATADAVATVASTPPPDDPHAEHRRAAFDLAARDPNFKTSPSIPLQRVIAIAAERHVVVPYAIVLPRGATGVFSIVTDRNHALSRAFIHLDRYSGRVLADIRYADFGFMGKFYSFGIIAHEGQLFGFANQLLGLAVALGLIALAVTGILMWWSRRPAGSLAAPVAPAPLFRLSRGAIVIAVALAALLPLMAASLIVLLAFDRVLSRRLPWLRQTAG